ncbi:hypothetical protein [Francisella hispaniensis]|uniref:hypothetical protein n=1 Tax=Francisella hispaniensis TaxID=622488 RepID=UPI0003088CA1|nr:hypothetical protein [Francisella hispaniensis]
MRLLILFIAVMFSLDSYATIYEKYQNGVPEFSNQQSQGAKQLNLNDDPVSVIDMNNIPHTIVWGRNQQQEYIPYSQPQEDTLQAAFPEEFTDNYFDFYGRNYQYHNLMSSTMGISMYAPSGANNMRLQRNY